MNCNLDMPCPQCPFLRKSLPGWLGPWTPESIIKHIKYHDVELACHMTVPMPCELNDEDPEDIQQCAGAAIFANHIAKLARNPERKAYQQKLKTNRRTVLKDESDLIRHHRKLEKEKTQ